jgi:hypothetical protein
MLTKKKKKNSFEKHILGMKLKILFSKHVFGKKNGREIDFQTDP